MFAWAAILVAQKDNSRYSSRSAENCHIWTECLKNVRECPRKLCFTERSSVLLFFLILQNSIDPDTMTRHKPGLLVRMNTASQFITFGLHSYCNIRCIQIQISSRISWVRIQREVGGGSVTPPPHPSSPASSFWLEISLSLASLDTVDEIPSLP